MPKEEKHLTEKDELTPEEMEEQNEKFRSFFSTTVVQVPQEMTRRDEEEPERGGWFRRLFRRKDKEQAEPVKEEAEDGLTLPTGEILLNDEIVSTQEPPTDLELAGLEPKKEPEPVPAEEEPRPAEPEQNMFAQKLEAPASEPEEKSASAICPDQPVPEREPEPEAKPVQAAPAQPPKEPAAKPAEPPAGPDKSVPSAPKQEAEQPVVSQPEQREPSRPASAPKHSAKSAPKHSAKHSKKSGPKPVRQPAPEDKELMELKAMLDTMGESPSPASKPAAKPAPKQMHMPVYFSAEAEADGSVSRPQPQPPARQSVPEPPQPAPAPEEKPVQEIAVEAPETVPPQETAAPEEPVPQRHRKPWPFRLFGAGEDETPDAMREDTMSVPLLETEEEEAAQAEPAAAESEPTGELPVEETAGEEAPQTPEEVGESLRHMSAALTLRCALSGILAGALLVLGLVSEGLLPPVASLDPVTAPAAFLGANLLLLLAALAVSYTVLQEGLSGLFGRASADTMPALASVAALIQAVVALMNAESYQASSLTLLSGMAALGLFLNTLGNRLMVAAVRGSYELISCGVEHKGAYRTQDKDLIRCLSEQLEEKDPWILLSRPMEWTTDFVEQSFSERASERRARKTSYILLAGGVLSGAAMLLAGRGVTGAAAAMAAVFCLGAPLSSTLIAGLASLQMQRTAGAVGAVLPGWPAIEELGGVDTVQVDAGDLFTPESAHLEDIRIFKGGRIDRAILYTASVLNQGCNTLSGLFRQIIEQRTDILFPVKDLEIRRGLGFSAWCDNCRLLIGTRQLMEQEGVVVPEQEYEDKHSRNGELQVLYLAVSGNLYAMFVLRYLGGRNAAHGLSILQKENIHLLVSCQDPTLTAQRIAAVYHLPEEMVSVLDQRQCDALEPALSYTSDTPCCMVHLRGFASLTGGLRAAEQAQTAETSATTVQLVSVWFSVLIGLLLTYAGSIGTLSLAAVLMYQAAWSGLSIAVCALKQHG